MFALSILISSGRNTASSGLSIYRYEEISFPFQICLCGTRYSFPFDVVVRDAMFMRFFIRDSRSVGVYLVKSSNVETIAVAKSQRSEVKWVKSDQRGARRPDSAWSLNTEDLWTWTTGLRRTSTRNGEWTRWERITLSHNAYLVVNVPKLPYKYFASYNSARLFKKDFSQR